MLPGISLNWPRTNFARFFQGEGPESTPVTLAQRRVFILPTRQGLFFILVLVVMLLGAINYNTSLGYGLIFLLVSVGLLTILHTYRNLLHLQIDIAAIKPTFCGETLDVAVLLEAPAGNSRYAIQSGFTHNEQQFVDIPAGKGVRVPLPLGDLRRGRHQLPRITLSSVFPLGLFRAWAYCQADHHFLIYPAPDKDHDLPQETSYHLNLSGYLGHGSDDFAGLRNYHPGDSLRHIHWKSFARVERLNTKQFGGDRADELWLDWESLPQLDLEARLSRLCRWCLDAEQGQFRYGLRLPGTNLALGHGPQHLHQCLEALALFPATTSPGKAGQ